jgi:hypothetical protein
MGFNNLDSLKGKELLLKKDFLKDIVGWIIDFSLTKNIIPVITGLTILDHLFSFEDGKQAQNYPQIYKDFTSLLDNLESDERAESLISKIVKKIVKRDDIEQILPFLRILCNSSECMIIVN